MVLYALKQKEEHNKKSSTKIQYLWVIFVDESDLERKKKGGLFGTSFHATLLHEANKIRMHVNFKVGATHVVEHQGLQDV
jgi:hypothetical protein